VPEALGALTLAGAAALAAARAAAPSRLAGGGGSHCLLRNRLGVPCPLCGGTTAVAHLVHGQPLAALAANPLVAVLAPIGVVLAVVLVGRWAGRVPGPRRWAPSARTVAAAWSVAAVLATWAWEWHRLGLAAPSAAALGVPWS
jgi:hypothetical protein